MCMSKNWPLDDVRNERWSDVDEYLDDLLFELCDDEKSLLLMSISAYSGVVSLVEKILISGGDPSFDLYHAACDARSLLRLLDSTDARTPVGSCILGYALHRRDTLDNLRSLVSGGADVNQFACSLYTPLQASIVYDAPKLALFFLEKGADPLAPSGEFDKPNSWEYAEKKPWALKMLKEFPCAPQ